MLSKFAKLLILVGSLGFGAAIASAVPAAAGGLSVTLQAPGFGVTFDDGHGYREDISHRRYREPGHRRHRGWRDRHWDGGYDRGYRKHRSCKPRRALRKAERRGLRRAHVVRIGHRNVIVAGRKWGDRVVVGFANVRGCPVRFVRAR